MQTSSASLIAFFDGEKQNVIPIFQRKYSWEDGNWRTLWLDILEIHEERMMKGNMADKNTLFMGAIVTMPVDSVPVGVNKHLVIDGQQRLTTFALLLVAIRDLADHSLQGRIYDYLVNRHATGPDRLKILSTHDDRNTFASLVESSDLTPFENHRMLRAVNFFKASLKQGNNSDLNTYIASLFETIRTCLEVVSINLSGKDDPYLIFESLNYKGEPLTAADLVRNYILMRFSSEVGAGGEQENIYRSEWLPLEKRLTLITAGKDGKEVEKSYLTDFLNHYLAVRGYNVKRGKTYTFFKRHMDKLGSTEEVKDAVIDLGKIGSYYERLIKPIAESEPRVRQCLESFIELKMASPYPLFLKLFSLRDQMKLDSNALVHCLELVESFVVRRFVCNIPTNSLGKMFDKWACEIDEENPADWLVKSLLDGSDNRRWPSDEEVKLEVFRNNFYGKNICRFLLVRIELSYGHKEVVSLEDSKISIEHIMPQTLSSDWKKDIGEEWSKVHEQLLNRLGNLTLTAYNPELSNKTFDIKRKELAKSKLSMNIWISEQRQWGEAEITQRTIDMGDRIASTWPKLNAVP